MKALSIWQPWASLIALGEKRFETRDWAPRYRGPLAIHAAKTWNADVRWYAEEFADILQPHGLLRGCGLPLGAIVATCTLAIIHPCDSDFRRRLTGQEDDLGDFSDGRFAWELRDVVRLPHPIPAKGAQGLWEWLQ